jgi:nucleotide-binding universal stress UspA family protein
VRFPYLRILNPIDFNGNSFRSAGVVAEFARQERRNCLPPLGDPRVRAANGAAAVCTRVQSRKRRGTRQTRRDCPQLAARRQLRSTHGRLQAILRAAATVSSDVIIMATHGQTGFSRAFLGSIAEDVLSEAPCRPHDSLKWWRNRRRPFTIRRIADNCRQTRLRKAHPC